MSYRISSRCDYITCHENVLISGDKEVEQVRVAHAVHCGDNQLTELKLRVVPGEEFAEKDKEKTETPEQLEGEGRSTELMQEGGSVHDNQYSRGKGHVPRRVR